MRGLRRSNRLVAGCLAVALAGLFVSGAAAAGTTFGRPTATARWGEGVTFEQPVTLVRAPTRAEVVIQSSGDSSPYVSEVRSPGPGPTTLRYVLDGGSPGLRPNTPFTARWRLTYPNGGLDLGPPVSVTYADTRFAWRTTTGPIVHVHWYVGGDAFAKRALRIGEDAIAKAASMFGVTEREPVDFFIYADQASFYDALGPGTRENVGGVELSEIRTLFALITPDEIDAPWVGRVIPHELTHLVFATAVKNPYHEPPRWLNEGLAVYLSQGFDSSDRAQVRSAAGKGELMPLDALTGEFPTTLERFALAYAESVSAVDYLVRTHGRPALVRLVRSYADGRTDDEAFSAALGQDATAFANAWLADLGAATPVRYGPQPAPPGPLPSGWNGPSSSPGTIGSGAGSAPDAGPGAADRPGATPAPPAAPEPVAGPEVGYGLVLAGSILALAGGGLYVRRRRQRPPA